LHDIVFINQVRDYTPDASEVNQMNVVIAHLIGVSTLDARKNAVYDALYQQGPDRALPRKMRHFVCQAGHLVSLISRPTLFAGDGLNSLEVLSGNPWGTCIFCTAGSLPSAGFKRRYDRLGDV
jgi:hypothetical protein